MAVQDEYERRLELWKRLSAIGTSDVAPQVLRDLGIYGGAQGIWVDKVTTGTLSQDGVTVGLLHTGEHYPDDLSADGLLYHYPETGRPPGRDAAEIRATKTARELAIPVFVILPGLARPGTRVVRLGWVEDWDDDAKQFLILFGESRPPYNPSADPTAPFSLTDERPGRARTVMARDGQARFRFEVLRMYGCKCAVCSITHRELVEAAHICGKKEKGSDDWRNGLPLCATHHHAFDAHLFAVKPNDALQVEFAPGVDAASIGILVERLAMLRHQPHPLALAWRYERAARTWHRGTTS